MPKSLPGPGPGNEVEIFTLAEELLGAYGRYHKNAKVAYDLIAPILEKEPKSRRAALLLKGHFYVTYAWEARGRGFANTVTKDGWRLMGERLAEAEKALEEAWKLGEGKRLPLDSEIATKMIGVELGQGRGRDRMELWFERAMLADGDNAEACLLKMNYLDPKWHGSLEEMKAFGQACYDTQNWEGFLPYLKVHAHRVITECYIPADSLAEYLQQPHVWGDIQAVQDGLDKHFPNDRFHTTRFLDWAVKAKKWELANKLILSLDGNYSKLVYSDDQYDKITANVRAAIMSQKAIK